jgi:Zn-dependent M28 family amino/carboxypeptidase
MVEGSDLSAGAVVVIAHYDHLGRSGDEIFHGADDNATGTAAVMEIAQAFGLAAEQGYRPRRTLIFIAASAEELGLYGSRYYTEHPLVPLDSTVACLNIDMIGRGSRKFSLTDDYIGGYVFLSKELLEVSEAGCKLTAPALADKIEYRKAIRGGSDHYHFATHGVPSIFYHTGLHSDYHKPSDTPDKILYDRMELIVRAIFATAWELANREERVDTGN